MTCTDSAPRCPVAIYQAPAFPDAPARFRVANFSTFSPFPMRRLLLLLATCVAKAAFAQQPADTTVLNPVVITATRVPIGQQVAPASVTVLRGEDLRSRGIATVGQALAAVPGLMVIQSGSFGPVWTNFGRGSVGAS